MIINVSCVKRDVGAVQNYHFSVSSLSIGTVTYTDLDISGEILNNGAILEVKGQILGQARSVCGRCLEPYLAKVEIPFQEDFKEGTPESNPEADLSWYQGNSIDMTETIRENLIFSEPFNQVCRDDCKGLCLTCGKNLNMETCSCTTEFLNPKFAVLQKLLETKDPNP